MPGLRVVESRVCGAGIGFRFVNNGFLGVGGGRFWWFGARMRRGFGVWLDEGLAQ